MEQIIKSGAGWRIGWKNAQIKYPALIGAEEWAIELTQAEFDDFCRLLQQLAATMKSISRELMPEERIACEIESELLWMEVEGYPHHYSLRLILKGDRACEGNWQAGVVPELIKISQTIRLF
ncbi:MAG: DUF1818 family protein [Cyanobacteria bacterium J083]|nr:MAG: DUF1818 family protein [Cyanobacteria bacterium J083]